MFENLKIVIWSLVKYRVLESIIIRWDIEAVEYCENCDTSF